MAPLQLQQWRPDPACTNIRPGSPHGGRPTSIFTTARTIANARFQASSFGLMFGSFRRINSGTLTADRTDNWPDGNVTFPAGTLTATTDVIGIGQTWQDVTGSRAHSTSYQNTTGRAILVAISCSTGTDRDFQVSSNGVTWINVATIDNTGSQVPFSVIVPNGWYYMISGSVTLTRWSELR
jgi:hypothetical protein